jgi:hypothetical protein
MLFAINESKAEELRKSSEPHYTITIAPGGTPVVLTTENYAPSCYDSMEISGTVMFAPTASKEAREYLMTLRENIEKSGVPLKSAQALNEEIDRMRSR